MDLFVRSSGLTEGANVNGSADASRCGMGTGLYGAVSEAKKADLSSRDIVKKTSKTAHFVH